MHERGGEVIVDGSHRRDCVIEVEDRPGKVRIGSDPTRVSGFDMCVEALDSATGSPTPIFTLASGHLARAATSCSVKSCPRLIQAEHVVTPVG